MRKKKIVGKLLQQLLKILQANTTKIILIIMKKFMFSALACIAFAGSSFASNEIDLKACLSDVVLEDPCILTLRVYSVGENGALTLVEIGGPSADLTGSACLEWALEKVKDAENRWPEHKVTYELVGN